MIISDEKLSGFLDAELNQEEMEQVRQALETDDELVMRLAQLSQVDQWVVENAQQIDQQPVPQRLTELAQQIDAKQGSGAQPVQDNVVQMSKWKKHKPAFKLPYSIAAGVALVAAVGLLTLNQETPNSSVSTEIAGILDTTVSGQTTFTENGLAVKTQLSFANHQGQLCRQYQMATDENSSTSIACKQATGWHIEAQHSNSGQGNSEDYQTASSEQELDAVIDQLIDGSAMDKTQEQQAIANNWLVNK
ncbi:MAG: hypothetical protein ABJV04_14900 [Aliiglaciecola sp.]|uniref:anti-sigma factor family protein n=1 Tax=Aliiglaciecola sp. TaxID=1872441 RepID=UPI0032993089